MQFVNKSLILLLMILAFILSSCMNNENKSTENNLTTWDEERVYAFLNEVQQYVRGIPHETKSKNAIVKMYEKYFTTELSMKIVESLYIKENSGWKVPDSDGGYIFTIPTGEYEGSELTFEFRDDYIKIRETYEIGMYSAIEYTIGYKGKPVIIDWKYE